MAQLFRSGAGSCWVGGQDKGLTFVTSGWTAGDAESRLTSVCAGAFPTDSHDGYIDIERFGWPDRPACLIKGFRVPGSGPLTITSAPEGRGEIALSSQRDAYFEIRTRSGARGTLRLDPCLAYSDFEFDGKAFEPVAVPTI